MDLAGPNWPKLRSKLWLLLRSAGDSYIIVILVVQICLLSRLYDVLGLKNKYMLTRQSIYEDDVILSLLLPQ